MLTLSRKKDEAVVCRDTQTGEVLLTVTVVRLEPNRVYLGFQAPREVVSIAREEIDDPTHVRGE